MGKAEKARNAPEDMVFLRRCCWKCGGGCPWLVGFWGEQKLEKVRGRHVPWSWVILSVIRKVEE
jgi:hypothetical protein